MKTGHDFLRKVMTALFHKRAIQMTWYFLQQYLIYIYLFISSCQYLINGLKEIFLHQRNAEYAMKYVEVKGDSRVSVVFGVI